MFLKCSFVLLKAMPPNTGIYFDEFGTFSSQDPLVGKEHVSRCLGGSCKVFYMLTCSVKMTWLTNNIRWVETRSTGFMK